MRGYAWYHDDQGILIPIDTKAILVWPLQKLFYNDVLKQR